MAKAAKFLADADVPTPVALNLQYNPDHYGVSSSEEYAAIKGQLDATGLFQVNLQSTEWVTYTAERVKDAYPLYQLGWFPDFPDADNYLTPFFTPDNFLGNHFENPEITALITDEATAAGPGEAGRAHRPDPGRNGQQLHLDDAAADRQADRGGGQGH